MLGLSKKTRGQLMRSELGESWEHFLQAASHAANGVGSSVGPSTAKMREAAVKSWGSFAPLAAAYREGAADALKLSSKTKAKAKKGKQMSNKRMGMLVGLLAAGAAVGAAGALVMKRRKQKNWSEFDPNNSLGLEGGGINVQDDAKSIVDKATSKMDTAMDKAAHHTNKVRNVAADKLEQTASSLRNSDFKAKIDDAAEAVNDATDSKFTASKHNGRF